MMYTIITPINSIPRTFAMLCRSIYYAAGPADLEWILIINGSITESCLTKEIEDVSNAVKHDISKVHVTVKIVQSLSLGVSAARNKGIKEASGDYLIFMDADDFFSASLIQVIEKHIIGNRSISFGKVKGISVSLIGVELLNLISVVTLFSRNAFIGTDLLFAGGLSGLSGTFIRRDKCPGFDENIDILEDYFFYIKALEVCGSVFGITDTCYFYYKSESSLQRLTRYKPNAIQHARDEIEKNTKILQIPLRHKIISLLYTQKNKAFYAGSTSAFFICVFGLCIISRGYFSSLLYKLKYNTKLKDQTMLLRKSGPIEFSF